MRLALFQPDIPQNLGAAVRLSACLAVPLEVIEPCAFPLTDKSLKRAALDYGQSAPPTLFSSWNAFLAGDARNEGRLILFTTRGAAPYHRFAFQPGDTLRVNVKNLLNRQYTWGSGVPGLPLQLLVTYDLHY